MNRLEDIRKLHVRLLETSARGGLSYSGVQDQQAIGFLLRAVEQLTNIAKIASSPEYEDGEWNFLTAIDGLEPDIRELVDARSSA